MNRIILAIVLGLCCLFQPEPTMALDGCQQDGATLHSQRCIANASQLPAASPPTAAAPPATRRCDFIQAVDAIVSADSDRLQRCQNRSSLLKQQDQRKSSLGRTLLHWAVANQQLAAARMLIQLGAPLNTGARADKGAQPIHLAAANGHTVMINLLLNHGADSEARDYFHQTPLHWASRSGQLETVRQLIRMGANPDSQDRTGKTTLMLAIRNDQPEMTSLLLDSGADSSLVDKGGNGALHLAAIRSIEQLKRLLPQLPIDQLNSQGQTPLMYVAALDPHRYWSTIRYLAQQGARTDLRDNQQRGLLDYSLEHNHLELFELLLAQGLNSDQLTLGQLKGKPAFVRRLIELKRL